MREVRGTKKNSRDCRYIVSIWALFTQTEPVVANTAHGVGQADDFFWQHTDFSVS